MAEQEEFEPPLPPSVESLIHQICTHQSQPPPSPSSRQLLASLGEQLSLKLLTHISRTTITRSFDGFIFHLSKQLLPSPSSPPSPGGAGIVLPPAVEELIGTICRDQSQPPLGFSAKRKLAMLEEEEAVKLLETIRRSKITKSFDGFVMTLLKCPSPVSPRPESVFLSPSLPPSPSSSSSFCSPCPNFRPLDEATHSVQDGVTLSPITTARRPGGQPFIQYNEYAPSPSSSCGTPTRQFLPNVQAVVPSMKALDLNGQTLSPRNNVGTRSGQFVAPPTNVLTPNAQAHVPYMNASNPNGWTLFPCSSVGKPNEHCGVPPTNVLQNNAQAYSMNACRPNGQTLFTFDSAGEHNGQCIVSPANVMKPNAQPFVTSTDTWRTNGQTVFPSTSAREPVVQCLVSSTNNALNPNAQALVPSTNVLKPEQSSVLQALHELEYRRAFLILSYIGRNKLEEVTNVSEINSLAGIRSMEAFENRIWHRFGVFSCDRNDRVQHLDWESGRRYFYHCYVYSDGSYSLKGPHLSKTATLLHKVVGDENVLIVKFYDSDDSRKSFGSSSVLYAGIQEVIREGILVGLKRFRFFVFKDGGKEEKNKSGSGAIKSYYVNVDSFSKFYQNKASCLDMISMHDRRCIFMHVHTVSSLSAYMARFSLILSKTITLEVNMDDPDVCVEVIGDIPCKNDDGLDQYDVDGKLQIHTDGTGFISEELALRCPRSCYQGSSLNNQFLERYLESVRLGSASTSQFKPDLLQPPLLIQFRMFYKGRAVKGTVLVNKKLKGKIIQIRPSMIKVEPDARLSCTPAVNSFEIVSTSNRPGRARLSRSLIGLLYYGGVPRDFFMDILSRKIWESNNIFSNPSAALRVAVNHGDMDDNYIVAKMILSGIPLDESYIQWRLPILGKEEHKSLKEGRLPVGDSFFLMGTADPTGLLKSNEVCVIHENGQIEGFVLVYRHPGQHFGDIHILKATRVKKMVDFVGTSKYGIFFPTNGPRSLADKMAGGDYDGDMYFVSRHPTLVTCFKQSEPWTPTAMCPQSTRVNRKPSEFTTPEELEHEIFKLFFNTRFHPSFTVGQAADAWLCHMDELLSLGDEQMGKKRQVEDKMRKLVDIYYEALDAPKKGKKVEVPGNLIPKFYPHYMGRKQSYDSKSILGEIFNKVDEFNMEAPVVQVRKLPCFDTEVPLRCITLWEDHYISYRKEMCDALSSGSESKNDAANNVIQKYKQILYGADEFEKSPRAWEEIRFDALAIYHVVYSYAMQQNRASCCGVAWKVAGPALRKINMEVQGEEPILCLPSVLRNIL